MVTVTRARLRADRRPWAEARSLADLGELTAQWLEGKILHQPGYCDAEPGECANPGPDEETAPLIPLLAACCRAGYVTTCSQPGYRREYEDDWDQRAAVEGLCNADAMLRLALLAERAGLIVIVHGPATLPRWRTRQKDAMPVSAGHGQVLASFGAQRSRRELRDFHTGYGECHPDAVNAVTSAYQLILIDHRWGKNDRLWAVLERFAGVSP